MFCFLDFLRQTHVASIRARDILGNYRCRNVLIHECIFYISTVNNYQYQYLAWIIPSDETVSSTTILTPGMIFITHSTMNILHCETSNMLYHYHIMYKHWTRLFDGGTTCILTDYIECTWPFLAVHLQRLTKSALNARHGKNISSKVSLGFDCIFVP